jgi:putative hemolysin
MAFQASIRALPKPMPRAVRNHGDLDPTLGRMGSLEARLAITKKDIRRAQKLRYRVFFEEGGAIADARSALSRRDICPFDRICDHMLVIDHDARGKFGRKKPKVVGTYRLLRQDMAEKNGGFYSAQEFDIAPLLAQHAGLRVLATHGAMRDDVALDDARATRLVMLLGRNWKVSMHDAFLH